MPLLTKPSMSIKTLTQAKKDNTDTNPGQVCQFQMTYFKTLTENINCNANADLGQVCQYRH